ncbi:hypothetical protein ABZU53_04810 [Micromonospora sp. NPDC005194]|uniref:hypothetical protein n=1 Tax=Micromonospora sp. NPDC005194 TaxID=3156870 RepID=UPI0033B75106
MLLNVSKSESQRFRSKSLAARRDDSLAGTVRWLVDKEWENRMTDEGVKNAAREG